MPLKSLLCFNVVYRSASHFHQAGVLDTFQAMFKRCVPESLLFPDSSTGSRGWIWHADVKNADSAAFLTSLKKWEACGVIAVRNGRIIQTSADGNRKDEKRNARRNKFNSIQFNFTYRAQYHNMILPQRAWYRTTRKVSFCSFFCHSCLHKCLFQALCSVHSFYYLTERENTSYVHYLHLYILI